MLESWVLIEHKGAEQDALRRVSLRNAKQLVVGNVPGQIIVHLAATTSEDLNTALVELSNVSGVTGASLLAVRREH